jgi:hypothetical protein
MRRHREFRWHVLEIIAAGKLIALEASPALSSKD